MDITCDHCGREISVERLSRNRAEAHGECEGCGHVVTVVTGARAPARPRAA